MRFLVNKYVFNLTVLIERERVLLLHARVTGRTYILYTWFSARGFLFALSSKCSHHAIATRLGKYFIVRILRCSEQMCKLDTHLWCCESSWKRALTKSTWTILLSWRWRRRHCCDYAGRTRSVRVHQHSLNGGGGGGGCGSCGTDRCPSPAPATRHESTPAAATTAVVTCVSIPDCLRTDEKKEKKLETSHRTEMTQVVKYKTVQARDNRKKKKEKKMSVRIISTKRFGSTREPESSKSARRGRSPNEIVSTSRRCCSPYAAMPPSVWFLSTSFTLDWENLIQQFRQTECNTNSMVSQHY